MRELYPHSLIWVAGSQWISSKTPKVLAVWTPTPALSALSLQHHTWGGSLPSQVMIMMMIMMIIIALRNRSLPLSCTLDGYVELSRMGWMKRFFCIIFNPLNVIYRNFFNTFWWITGSGYFREITADYRLSLSQESHITFSRR